MKTAHDPQTIRYIEAFGPIRVPGLKNVDRFSKPQQRAMYDIGAALSRHFQFDYQDLTFFERQFAKAIFPFYTFYKNNFLLQASQLARAPKYVQGALAMENYLQDYGVPIGIESEVLPEYFSNLNAFQIPVPNGIRQKLGLPPDMPLFLNPKLPFVSLNLFPAFWEIFKNDGFTDYGKALQLAAPVLGAVGPFAPVPVPGAKIMFEAWTNTQFGLNQKIDFQRSNSNDWRQSFVDAPPWVRFVPKPMRDFFAMIPMSPLQHIFQDPETNGFKITATGRYMLEQMATPFITSLGKSIPMNEPGIQGEKARADMVSWLTGVRLIPADPFKIHISWAYRMKNTLEAERQSLRKRGSELEPDDLVTLRMITRLVKILNAEQDLRDEELTGSGTSH